MVFFFVIRLNQFCCLSKSTLPFRHLPSVMDISRLKNHRVILLSIVVFIFLSTSSKPILASRSNENDKLALLAVKDRLVGASTGALTSWNASLGFCEWQGVKCGRRHRRVISLNVSSLQLAGSISPSIGNLTFLREVNLSYNRLQGSIPKEIGHLRRLRSLDLAFNYLQAKIPEGLSNCSNLQMIRLRANNLIGEIPFSLGDLNKLIRFQVASNNFSGGIPSFFGNISSLRVLSLRDNNLEGTIPNSLSKLSKLEYLYVGYNDLSGSITPVYNLSSLIGLEVSENQLFGRLPPDVGLACPNLEVAYLESNLLTGTIPSSITNLSCLQIFDIGFNGFHGSVPYNVGNLENLLVLNLPDSNLGNGEAGDLNFFSSLINCTQLQYLGIPSNKFGGLLPNSLANLTWLEYLSIGGNQITGSIPEGIGNLVNLDLMDMRGNLLVGKIPFSIGNLQNLEGLYLASNHMTGKIPSSIGNLTRLSELDLSKNKFDGAIPSPMKKCKSLQKLDLSQNKLNSRIPHQVFGAFENLVYLNLSHNFLTGLFPSDLGNLKNLVELYANHNNFFGEIPKTLGASIALRILFMQKNSFQGNIPQSFASLRSLENLDLSNNNLSGAIPSKLQELPFLVSLDLSFNNLEGEVPKRGVFKNVSGFTFFKNKKLCGGIPEIELPKCFIEKPKKKGKILLTKVIVAIILSMLLVSILAVLIVYHSWKRKSTRGVNPVANLFNNGYMHLSYKELLEATQGFASSNLIGSGSFGSVYKAVLHQQEKPVAVKVLNLRNSGVAKSFMAECRTLGKVRHRNLLKIITSCSSIDYQGNEFKALVFEFMPNGSLESWLHEQHESRYLNLSQMVDIAIDVANAIDYLHHDCETPIVHCDLKPANILLDDEMIAHVGDFGLAKLLSSCDQTYSSTIKGTIGYFPPEYNYMGGEVSPKGDIYSYGILLLEMITGRRPTDDLFHDGLSLHNFCKKALQEGLKEIIDFRMLDEIGENRQKLRSRASMEGEIWECLVSFTKIGVACSAEAIGDRMRIKDAITELHAAKARLLRIGVYRKDRS